jgi:signal recognition particle GTPase
MHRSYKHADTLFFGHFTVDNYHVIHVLQEILLVLDGTTGLNMLQQAREFNDVIIHPIYNSVLNS